MSRFRRIELVEPYYHPLVVRETSIFASSTFNFPSFVEDEVLDLTFAVDFLNPNPSPFEVFDSVTDLVQIERTPSLYSYKRIQRRVEPELLLRTSWDRVSTLESRFDRLLNERVNGGDRKYTWTAEIEGGSVDRKYKWTAEIKEGKKKEKEVKRIDKSYKWTAKIKGKGDEESMLRTYAFEASTGNAGVCTKSDKEEKKKLKKKRESDTRVVEIEDPADHGAVVRRQAFAKRDGVIRSLRRKKHKELSPQDAALIIQMTFRAYLIRRSQTLRALRDLAGTKTKLKEIRTLFNFSYRHQVARDAEERQRFLEEITVLLLTVDAIEGVDLMVRAAKRSMVDELEAMLDVVDPQAAGRALSIRRRTFDIPDCVIQKEIAAGVAQVVQIINEAEKNSATFEACI